MAPRTVRLRSPLASVLVVLLFLNFDPRHKHLACQVSTEAAHQAADARDDSRLHWREWREVRVSPPPPPPRPFESHRRERGKIPRQWHPFPPCARSPLLT